MKNHIKLFIFGAILTLPFTGCGGGGGGGGGPTTQAVVTLHLFGQMSSQTNTKIQSVDTSINLASLPIGVFVNYTAPVGTTTGVWPMRAGFAVPSGNAQVPAANIVGSYDIGNKKVNISIINKSGFFADRVALQSYTSARGGRIKGAEIAKIFFKLNPAGTSPTFSLEDRSPTVFQVRTPGPPYKTKNLNDCIINFDTTYQ